MAFYQIKKCYNEDMEKHLIVSPSIDKINKTIESLTKNGFLPEVVATGEEA